MAYTKRPHTSNGKSADNKKSRSPQKKSRAEVITYRLESEMVYVEPADTMEDALDYAQSVFPQLANVSRSQITFSVNVRVGTALRSVRIASMAWKRVMNSLATYEIVDIAILPSSIAMGHSNSDSAIANVSARSSTEELPPPLYSGEKFYKDKEASQVGTDLYSSGVFMGCEMSPLCTTPRLKRRGSLFGWLLRRP